MGDFSRPAKKIRLDTSINDFETAGNEDLWGQYDLTAEEFDMLEVQATQEVDKEKPAISNGHLVQMPTANVKPNTEKDSKQIDEIIQQQYELEGKNIALTQLLEKTVKELNDERKNQRQLLDETLNAHKIKETELRQAIEKLNTSLRFKDQEINVEKSKTHTLENKLKGKQNIFNSSKIGDHSEGTAHVSPLKKSPTKYPNWNSFDCQNRTKTVESEIQTVPLRCRESALSLQSQRGKHCEIDAVCKLLSCRIVDSFSKNHEACILEGNKSTLKEIFNRARDSSSMCVAMLRCRVESDNIWHPYEKALQEYISLLRIGKSSHKFSADHLDVPSVSRVSHFNSEWPKNEIVECLRDLTRLTYHIYPKKTFKNITYFGQNQEKKNPTESFTAHSMPLFSVDEEKMDGMENHGHHIIELLILLANPNTYPKDYQQAGEMQWALASLAALSSHSDLSLEACIQDLPLHSLISGQHGMECAYLSLNLTFPLIGSESFKQVLVHRSNSCILCSIKNLCQLICDDDKSKLSDLFMKVVVTFVSASLFSYGFDIMGNDTMPCSSQLLHGILSLHLKQLKSSPKCDQIVNIEKGVKLLSFIAKHLSNFRARHMSAKDDYITLICALTKLCKENHELKPLQDVIRELCDFQDDYFEHDSE